MGSSKLKVKVVAKGKKATDLVKTLAGMPDSSGANFVSRNDLHLDAGAISGKNRASQHVPYKSRPGWDGKNNPAHDFELVGNEREQVGKPETGAKVALNPIGFGPSHVGEEINTVKPVARDLNPVERARQANNRTRDMRTNLGRSKPAIVEVE